MSKKIYRIIILFNVFLIIQFSIVIFGVIYKSNTKQINSLYQYTIFIDPGHGGKDNGASYNQVAEDEINLHIASMVYETLLDNGAYVFLTRTGDYDLSDMYTKNHKLMDLNKRIKYIVDNKADLFISIHLNSYSDGNVSGAQVFYKKNLQSSNDFALIMQEKLNKLNKKDKKPKTGDYYILNNTLNINGIIIECGFLSNEEERKKLTTSTYQEKLANFICEGIIDYLSYVN